MEKDRNRIGSVEEFYADALDIEREAASRYWEFANQLLLFRQNKAAAVFLELAKRECEELDRLERQAAEFKVPARAPSRHRWRIEDSGKQPLPVARCLMKPRRALETALRNQRRVKNFYEGISASAENPDISRLAAQLASQEERHMECVKRALQAR